MINTLIFDIDMTLVDSLDACRVGANMMARNFGLREVTREDVLKVMTLTTREFWETLWGGFEPEWLDYFAHVVVPQVRHLSKMFPEAEDILKSAKKRGFLLAVATNRANPWLDLGVLGIAKYFDTAVGCTDVPRPKPEPDMLLTVLRQLGVEASSALYAGDSPLDMRCAAAAGIRSLGLTQSDATPGMLSAAGASAVRPSLAEARDVLGC
ncbi:MAG: HAD family hydrolase [Deltaproteobacteria bacterium]|jgi:HAD superfamily hydrolase (TIGR01509 family)|nr:HAD family hydrolase [Deltaproteobacteria bacterium]